MSNDETERIERAEMDGKIERANPQGLTLGWKYKWKQITNRRRTRWRSTFNTTHPAEQHQYNKNPQNRTQDYKDVVRAVRFEETGEIMTVEESPWIKMLVEELNSQ